MVTARIASKTESEPLVDYDFHNGNGDNGNVFGITNYKDANRNQTFTYDGLNRVTSAQNAGTDCNAKVLQNKTEYWGNNYTYDAWGNLLGKTVTKYGAENLSLTADAHNWIHGQATPEDILDNVEGPRSTRNGQPDCLALVLFYFRKLLGPWTDNIGEWIIIDLTASYGSQRPTPSRQQSTRDHHRRRRGHEPADARRCHQGVLRPSSDCSTECFCDS